MICESYVNKFIRKTLAPNKGILAELEKEAKQNNVPIIKPEVAGLISVLGLIKKPSRILEAGTAIGYSAILLASFLSPGGKIDTIERNEAMLEKADVNIKKAGLDQVINIIPGDAVDVLNHIDKRYDMIFLDSSKGHYIEMLPDCLRLLEKGGLLISDNVLYKGMVADDSLVLRRKKTIVHRMREYLDNLCNNEMLETTIIPAGDGVAISYRR